MTQSVSLETNTVKSCSLVTPPPSPPSPPPLITLQLDTREPYLLSGYLCVERCNVEDDACLYTQREHWLDHNRSSHNCGTTLGNSACVCVCVCVCSHELREGI